MIRWRIWRRRRDEDCSSFLRSFYTTQAIFDETLLANRSLVQLNIETETGHYDLRVWCVCSCFCVYMTRFPPVDVEYISVFDFFLRGTIAFHSISLDRFILNRKNNFLVKIKELQLWYAMLIRKDNDADDDNNEYHLFLVRKFYKWVFVVSCSQIFLLLFNGAVIV